MQNRIIKPNQASNSFKKQSFLTIIHKKNESDKNRRTSSAVNISQYPYVSRCQESKIQKQDDRKILNKQIVLFFPNSFQNKVDAKSEIKGSFRSLFLQDYRSKTKRNHHRSLTVNQKERRYSSQTKNRINTDQNYCTMDEISSIRSKNNNDPKHLSQLFLTKKYQSFIHSPNKKKSSHIQLQLNRIYNSNKQSQTKKSIKDCISCTYTENQQKAQYDKIARKINKRVFQSKRLRQLFTIKLF